MPYKTSWDTGRSGCVLANFFISRREMNISKREMNILRREMKKLSVFVSFLPEYECFLSVTFSGFVQ